MLFKSCILIALIALASGSPVSNNSPPTFDTKSPFILLAHATNQHINNYPLVAKDGEFWVGDNNLPPSDDQTAMKTKNELMYLLDGSEGNEKQMWVSKKGKGSLKYNPDGATETVDAYQIKADFMATEPNEPALLVVANAEWLACPDKSGKNFQVFVKVKELQDDKHLKSCKQFSAQVVSVKK